MKEHDQNEFWTYKNINNKVQIVYFVDGRFRSEHMTAQHLIDNYNIDFGNAYKYIHEITICH